MPRFWLLILATIFYATTGLATTVLRVNSKSELKRQALLPHTLHYENRGASCAADSLPPPEMFEAIAGNGVIIQSEEAHWLTFQIENESTEALDVLIAGLASYTDSIDLYERGGDGQTKHLGRRGDRVYEHDSSYRLPLFPVQISSGLHTYYLCIQTQAPVNLKFHIWDSNTFFHKSFIFEYALLMAGFGVVFVMILYNSFLALRLLNRSFFFYVGYIATFACVQFIFSGLGQHFFPNHPFKAFLNNSGILIFAELCATFCCFFAYSFLDLKKNSPIIAKLIPTFICLSVLNMGLAVFFHKFSATFVLFTNCYMSTLLLVGGFHCVIRRHRPAYFYLIAWLFFIVGNLLTMGQVYGFFPDNPITIWAQFGGGVIESVLLSLALGDKISVEKEFTHAQIQQLNIELSESNHMLSLHVKDVEAIVEQKTRDIRSIMDHIPIGIFMIGQDHTFHRDASRSLDTMLPRTEKDNALDLLFSGSTLTEDERSQIRSGVCASLGEYGINFEINAHLLPTMLTRYDASGERRIFDLTWNAIESRAGLCDKILVTIRDLTDIRSLEEKSSNHLENEAIIAEILKISPPVFVRFVRSARTLIQENEQVLNSLGQHTQAFEILKLMFINLHTIKGSSRSLYLRKLTSVLHEVEQYFANCMRVNSGEWNMTDLRMMLGRASTAIDRYTELAQVHLGRNFAGNKLEFERVEIETIYSDVSSLAQPIPSENFLAKISSIKEILMQHLYRDGNEVFRDILSCIPILAKDLDKEEPRVALKTDNLWLNERADELCRNVFLHLIRNTMDHGLESRESRIAAQKSPRGSIDIQLVRHDDVVQIRYADDGRGLATKRILAIMGSQKSRSGTRWRFADIAEMVFAPGFSTADQISDISGRGIGMSAISTFIQDHGGKVELVATETFQAGKEFHSFAVLIELPFTELFEQLTLALPVSNAS